MPTVNYYCNLYRREHPNLALQERRHLPQNSIAMQSQRKKCMKRCANFIFILGCKPTQKISSKWKTHGYSKLPSFKERTNLRLSKNSTRVAALTSNDHCYIKRQNDKAHQNPLFHFATCWQRAETGIYKGTLFMIM